MYIYFYLHTHFLRDTLVKKCLHCDKSFIFFTSSVSSDHVLL